MRRWTRTRQVLRACLLACAVAVSIAGLASGAEPIRYVVDLQAPATQRVRVTLRIPDAPPATEIQMPAWNNLYQIRDFVRDVQDLQGACNGQQVTLLRVDLETWRGPSQSCRNLEVRYAVDAHEEGPFSSVFNTRHAFLNFATVLFYLPRERSRSVRVRFVLPAGWRLATFLDPGDGPDEFQAANYDVLVDSPAEAGNFQEYTFTQQDAERATGAATGSAAGERKATYRVIVHADAADYSPQRLLASLEKITGAATAMMRDVPFSNYTFIFHFPREGGGGGMEHRNGTAISVPASDVRDHWGRVEATAAHEFFHLWNVKRIRPQALEPIDYVHGNDTRDLWFAEGVTSTYGTLTLLRAGLMTPQEFYLELAGEIDSLQARPARGSQSLETSGREAWLEKYADYFRPDRSISYYNKGELVGFLLDLALRHASHNRAGLDEIMRRLNEEFARRGRFYTESDLRRLVHESAPQFSAADAFFNDYLHGTQELDYDTYLGYAGLRVRVEAHETPALGFTAATGFEGTLRVASIEPGSPAEQAGLATGDVLVKMNGRNLTEAPQSRLAGMTPGEKVKFQVRRARRNLEFKYHLGTTTETRYRVEEIPGSSAGQLEIRRGWLQGTTTPGEVVSRQ